jgi:PAS domain S-box-containing protein
LLPARAPRAIRTTAQPEKVRSDLERLSFLAPQPTQEALAQSETVPEFWRNHRIYDLAPVGFLTLDRQARILELNKKAAELLSLPVTWLLHRPFLVFVAKHGVESFVRFLVNSPRDARMRSLELDLLIERHTVPVQISLTTIGVGDTFIHEMAIVDLTEIKKTESWLQESLAHWYSLVQNAPDTIMTLERTGKIVFVNTPLWGCSVNALIGTRIFDHVPDAERLKVRRCFNRVFKSEQRSQCEIARAEGDRQLWFALSFGPAKIAGGSGLTTLLIRDVSEQKRSEEIMRASSEQLRDFAARLDAVREEERTRVARELHDELGQLLTILKLDLSWVHRKLSGNGELRKKMKGMIAHVDDTIQRVRRISSELRPPILDDLGLGAAIEWQASEFQKRTGIRIQVMEADNVVLPQDAQAATFRVVQEALTNVIRHAAATRVRLVLKSESHAVRISIEDNGKGMTGEQMKDAKSLGIVGMKERIARLSGEFNIFSEPGKGTRLDITIPAHHD